MALAPKLALAFGGLAAVGVGVVLWARFATLVYLDSLASAFAGCLY
jgi:hypothetical protein